jgi:16S rRNA C1402 (ribose-2'-O) methylase RsmI
MFEETLRGTLGELADALARRELKGEVVVVVAGREG